MNQWGPLVGGVLLAVMGWAAAFGMLRAQVQGLRRDFERLIAQIDRTMEKQDRLVHGLSNVSSDVAVLAALANMEERTKRVVRRDT